MNPRPASLAYPAAIALCLLLGAALRYPALDAPPLADDYDHYAMMHGRYPVQRNPLDLYAFVGADERAALMAAGRLPWWSDPELRLSAFRPLSSLSIALDHTLLGGDPRAAHLHSLAWWVLAMLAVAGLLRALLPPAAATLGLSIYALEEAHTFPLLWAANRHTLIATGLGAGAIWMHVVARRQGSRGARWAAVGFAGLALGAGEYALALLAYVLAYELMAARDARRVRLLALAPYAVLGFTYLTLRAALGHGVAGSGFYVSPLHAPLSYLGALLERAPLLLADLVFSLPAELAFADAALFDAQARAIQLAAGALALALIAALALRPPRALGGETRWLLGGSLLSLLPLFATLATTRLLLSPAIGTSAVLGLLGVAAARALRRAGTFRTRFAAALGGLALLALQIGLPALRDLGEARYLGKRARAELAWALGAELPAAIADKTLLVFAAQDWLTACALPYALARAGRAAPRASHLLSGAAGSGHELHRIALDALELRVLDAAPRAFAGSVYRPTEAALEPGHRVALDGLRVEVLEARGGQPTRLRFRFAHPPDDARYWFLFPTRDGIRHIPIPPLGSYLRLPPASAAR